MTKISRVCPGFYTVVALDADGEEINWGSIEKLRGAEEGAYDGPGWYVLLGQDSWVVDTFKQAKASVL